MQVTINGEPRDLNDGITLAELVRDLELTERRIAVEINESIVPKSLHAETALKADDAIEIIHAIGGG